MELDFVERPSPNCDDRQLPVSMIVLHYTGMADMQSALDRLTSPKAHVSSHYLVDEDGIDLGDLDVAGEGVDEEADENISWFQCSG